MAQNCWIHSCQLVFAATLNSDVTEAEVSPNFFSDKPEKKTKEGERMREKEIGGKGEKKEEIERGEREREKENERNTKREREREGGRES